jgi:hypothetical protein
MAKLTPMAKPQTLLKIETRPRMLCQLSRTDPDDPTPYCLAPGTKFSGVPIGSGKPGPMWRRILDRWREIVGKNIHEEIAASR